MSLRGWLAVPLALFCACGGEPAGDDDDDTTSPPEIDEALLETYRQAIPSADLLAASAPEASAAARSSSDAVGEPAIFPQHAVPVAESVNQTVVTLLETLHAVVQNPPTAYNSETLEFLWGPYDDGGTSLAGDTFAVYIRDEGESSSFRYTYAFMRGMGTDVATLTPIIWGGTNPSEDETLSGAAVWDFEENYAFEETYNPGHGELTRGRFAEVFARDYAEDDPTALVTIIISAFRDFQPEGSTGAVDLDYLWGNVTWPGAQVDFLDFAYQMNLEVTSTDAEEQVGERLAFYNSGVGRAEVDFTGGDIPTDYPGQYILATECWDSALLETYLEYALVSEDSGESTVVGSEGSADQCALTSLEGIPSLDDVDEDLLAQLDALASGGVAAASSHASALAAQLAAVRMVTP